MTAQALQRFWAMVMSFACAQAAFGIDAGQLAPDFNLRSAGRQVKLSESRGQWVYVDFWASWCGPCRQSFPWMNEMQEKYGGKGLRILAINVDSNAADADRFLKQLPAKFTVLFDPAGDTPRSFGVKSMPGSFLIDPQGRVSLVHSGFRESDRASLEAKFAAAVAGDGAALKAAKP